MVSFTFSVGLVSKKSAVTLLRQLPAEGGAPPFRLQCPRVGSSGKAARPFNSMKVFEGQWNVDKVVDNSNDYQNKC